MYIYIYFYIIYITNDLVKIKKEKTRVFFGTKGEGCCTVFSSQLSAGLGPFDFSSQFLPGFGSRFPLLESPQFFSS